MDVRVIPEGVNRAQAPQLKDVSALQRRPLKKDTMNSKIIWWQEDIIHDFYGNRSVKCVAFSTWDQPALSPICDLITTKGVLEHIRDFQLMRNQETI